MYNTVQFTFLERMSREEVKEEIISARELYGVVQEQYSHMEQEMVAESRLLAPKLDILFGSLHNIESYIRKAENLLNQWDDTRYVNKAVKNFNKFNSIKLVNVKIIKGE